MDLTPILGADGKWRIDLRAKALGGYGGPYVLEGVPGGQEYIVAAVNAAVRLHARKAAAAAASSQQAALDFDGGPRFKDVALELLAKRLKDELPTKDNAHYIRTQFNAVARELGAFFVSAFVPPVGDDLLIEYRNRLAAEGKGPRTRRNRLSAVGQVLRHCWKTRRQWMPALPEIPEPTVGGEVLNDPDYVWQPEAEFRILRDRLWENHDDRDHGLRKHPSGLGGSREWRLDYIARRKLYLSTGFYTGMHTKNLDELDDRSLYVHLPRFLRRNAKSAACIPDEVKDAPEQLFLDVQEEMRRLGRFWRKGEKVAGGRWPTVMKVLNVEARRLGLPLPVGPRVWRRGVAYHQALLGWREAETAEYLGHVDDRMVKEVYRRIPEGRSPVRLDWTNANMARIAGGHTARAVVYDFERPAADRDPEARRPGLQVHTGGGGGGDPGSGAGPAGAVKPARKR